MKGTKGEEHERKWWIKREGQTSRERSGVSWEGAL